MGFYIRKSLSAGPFRFNLSKSGVGVSVGVPGFRDSGPKSRMPSASQRVPGGGTRGTPANRTLLRKIKPAKRRQGVTSTMKRAMRAGCCVLLAVLALAGGPPEASAQTATQQREAAVLKARAG